MTKTLKNEQAHTVPFDIMPVLTLKDYCSACYPKVVQFLEANNFPARTFYKLCEEGAIVYMDRVYRPYKELVPTIPSVYVKKVTTSHMIVLPEEYREEEEEIIIKEKKKRKKRYTSKADRKLVPNAFNNQSDRSSSSF